MLLGCFIIAASPMFAIHQNDEEVAMAKSVSLHRWLVPLLVCLGLLSALITIRWRMAADPDAEFEDEGKGKRNSGQVEAAVVAAPAPQPNSSTRESRPR